jgi:imidazolonepropionase-like amidohydrolase
MNAMLISKGRAGALFFGLLLLFSVSVFAQNGEYAIRDARIVPVVGPVIAKGSVHIKDGKIVAVGERISIPSTAKVIDGRGLSVYPGLIDSGTTLGLEEIGSIQETKDITELGDFNANAKAIVAVNIHSELIPVSRANGITTVLTSPGGRLISGQAALINLDGWSWQEMALKAAAAMEMEYPRLGGGGRRGGGGGGFQFAQQGADAARLAAQRQVDSLKAKLDEALAYSQAKDARAKDASLPKRNTDLVLEALIPVVKGEMPVLMQANTAAEIRGAIELADKYKLKLIITGADEAEKVAPLLKEKNIPVIIGPVTEVPTREDEGYDLNYSQAAALEKAGVRFVFKTSDAAYVRNLPYQPGTAAAFGLSRDEALKSVTIYPAQVFGVDKLIGSIEVGKIANIIVTDGDPLEFRTNTKYMFINGKPVDLASRHTKLYDKFNSRPQQD